MRNLNLINNFKGKFKLRIHERCRSFSLDSLSLELMHEPYEKKLGHIHDFKVKYRLYKPEEGGRKTGVTYQGIRYDFAYSDFGTKDFSVHMIWPEFENENGEVIIEDYDEGCYK
jgi:hypothetical protein